MAETRKQVGEARVEAWTLRRPALVVVLCVAALLGLAAGLARLQIDSSIQALLIPDDPLQDDVNRIRDLFGSDEVLVVGVEADDCLAAPILRSIRELTDTLGDLPGVASVLSLANANHIESSADGVRVAPFYRRVPSSEADLAAVRRRVGSDALARSHLLSKDGRLAAIFVFPEVEVDRDIVRQGALAEAVESVALGYEGAGRVVVTGIPLLKVANGRVGMADMGRIVPILLLANAIVLALLYRSARGFLIPVGTILLTLAATIGLVGHLGLPFDSFFCLVVFFVIMIAAAYTIHTMTSYFRSEEAQAAGELGPERLAPVRGMLAELRRPLVLIVLTTAVAFASLLVNPIPAVRHFGAFSAVGTVLLLPICLLLIPAVLALLGPRRGPIDRRAATGTSRVWGMLARAAARRPRTIVVAWAALVAAAVAGFPRLEPMTDGLAFLPSSHPQRQAEALLREKLGGTTLINVVLDTGAPGGAIDGTSLRRLVELESYARGLADVDEMLSVLDFLEPLHRAFDDLPPARAGEPRVLPASAAAAEELLFLYSYPEDLARVIDPTRTSLRAVVRLNDTASSAVRGVADALEAKALALGFPAGGVTVASSVMLQGRSYDEVSERMVESLALSLALIAPALLLLTRSARMTFLALVPNVAATALVIGAMAWLGFKLDLFSCTVPAITLGIAVDDTIHLLAHYRRERRAGGGTQRALEGALRAAGPAMAGSTGVLALSLTLLHIADYQPMVHLGQIAALGFIGCLAADLTLMPALLALADGEGRDEAEPAPAPAEADRALVATGSAT